MMRLRAACTRLAFAAAAISIASPAFAAESPRQLLVSAAFGTSDKSIALARIDAALKGANAALLRDPADREAGLQRALAISYRGKLNRSRADLVAARAALEALVAAHPRDAEMQMALAGWHLGAVIELGGLIARTGLGARKATGLRALELAMTLGAGRALFPALASLTMVQLNPHDLTAGRRLAEAAVNSRVATPIDHLMQKQAAALLPSLRPGNGKAAVRAARSLAPFGRLHSTLI